MKKLMLLFAILFMGLCSFASETEEVKQFFNSYIESANSYKSDYFDYYVKNPVITRVVIKKDGATESVQVPMDEYKRYSNLSMKMGKLRKYKNIYTNIDIAQEGSNYRLTAMRKPSTSSYSLPVSFLIGKDTAGRWKIKEESMHTKVQTFLKKGKKSAS